MSAKFSKKEKTKLAEEIILLSKSIDENYNSYTNYYKELVEKEKQVNEIREKNLYYLLDVMDLLCNELNKNSLTHTFESKLDEYGLYRWKFAHLIIKGKNYNKDGLGGIFISPYDIYLYEGKSYNYHRLFNLLPKKGFPSMAKVWDTKDNEEVYYWLFESIKLFFEKRYK